ncbi:MAG: nucleoside-diphosphate sugar epimerase/dehydratase [Terriglobales bacterium]|jgi:FlaA1/EpsC-like NDP-sugar epimerase
MNHRTSHFLLRHKAWLIATFQAGLIVCSLTTAWLLRFDFTLPQRRMLLYSLPVLVLIRLAAMNYFGLLRGWWKYVGIRDGIDILQAVGTGSVVFFLAMRYGLRAYAFPRSIYLLEPLLTAGLLGGVRILSRLLAESVRDNLSTCKRVMLIGAGAAAQAILREIHRPGSGYVAVGCLDDDGSKLDIRIDRVRVLGSVDQLPNLLRSTPADEVLIAIPSATGAQMCRFVEICTRAKISFHTVPALKDIIRGEVKVAQLREVSLEDLLGRDPVQIDLEAVSRHLGDKSVMVTGAAGSIGSELCRQILLHGPRKLVCVDQNETGMFYLQQELRRRTLDAQLVCCVADVGDAEGMRACFSHHRIDHTFHAAAYKHVPVMEENVAEAIRNNVFALESLLNVAEGQGCQSFVLISSDKAVNPTSVMGSSKRIGELMLAGRPKKNMRCVSVRFGNVLGSSGSVVPILQRQLDEGGPLTITHPEICRFFMTAQEAVSLVLEAFTIGCDGDILVLEMGKPIKIVDLARTLIRLSGKPADAVDIEFTGLRAGEKLEEELHYHHETILPTSLDKVKRINGATPDWRELCGHLRELRATLHLDGARPIRAKIQEMVPEYRCPSDLALDAPLPRDRDELFKSACAQD